MMKLLYERHVLVEAGAQVSGVRKRVVKHVTRHFGMWGQPLLKN